MSHETGDNQIAAADHPQPGVEFGLGEGVGQRDFTTVVSAPTGSMPAMNRDIGPAGSNRGAAGLAAFCATWMIGVPTRRPRSSRAEIACDGGASMPCSLSFALGVLALMVD